MKIISEVSIERFEAWSGGRDTLDRIINEGKCDILESVLEDMYPDGLTDTELNDILWFESENVYEWCGIRTESDIKAELEEAQEEYEELMQNYHDDCEEIKEECEEEDYNGESYEMRIEKVWCDNYLEDAEELETRIAELEEELENI